MLVAKSQEGSACHTRIRSTKALALPLSGGRQRVGDPGLALVELLVGVVVDLLPLFGFPLICQELKVFRR